MPFVGASGNLLRKHLMPSAGLDTDECYIANVFAVTPPHNDLTEWTANKTECKKLGVEPYGQPINKRYLLPKYWEQVRKTQAYIAELKPDLVICLGGTAQWCLSGDSRIGTFRGTFFSYTLGDFTGQAISTYHPAAVLRQWSFVPTVWADLTKARKYLAGTIEAPLRRRLYYNPSWHEMLEVYSKFRANPEWEIGCDIETAPAIDQITCISFCTETYGICIPIWDKGYGAVPGNVYSDPKEELKAWRWIERFCSLPNTVVFQNGMYDMQYMLDAPITLKVSGPIDDTVLLAHSSQPELQKSLGFLASIYTNEPSWKQMRTSDKDAKAED